jgi:hypothetical protein
VAAGVWHAHRDHYEVHDYLKYNPCREQVLASRAADAERKKSRRGGNVTASLPVSGRTPIGLLPESTQSPGALPGTPSRPVPSHTHSGLLDQDLDHGDSQRAPVGSDLSPDAQAILAALRSHKNLRDIADDGFAETLDGRRFHSGRSVEALAVAIADASADTPAGETVEAVRRRVRTYCDRARVGGGKAAPGAAGGAAWALAVWVETYAKSRRAYGTYTPTDEDDAEGRRVAAHAERLAEEERGRRGNGAPPIATLAKELVRHWAVSYLRDDGAKNHLAEARHPLRFLMRSVPTYGVPWTAKAKLRTTPPPTKSGPKPVGPPKEFLDALSKLGHGPAPPAATAPPRGALRESDYAAEYTTPEQEKTG